MKYKSVANITNPLSNSAGWIGDSETPLTGFSWRSGVDRDTTGLIIWSDVFLHDKSDGEKLAIILMDTQGLFDNQTTIADNSKIFALGTLLSSVQILNLFSIIQEDHLQYLQFATEFARFASNSSAGGKPFQNFMFLIRDWNNPDEYEFGNVGGENYMNKVLTAKPDQSPELKSVREFIKSSFDKLGCCLMPYPGKDVARTKGYDGRWSKMDEDFLSELKLVIPSLLAPENLVVKRINGVEMNSNLLNEFIQTSFALFQSNQLPEAKSIFESTVDKYMMSIVAKCVEVYNSNALNSKSTITDENSIGTVHEFAKSKAMLTYSEEKKMGNAEHVAKYKTILESQIEANHVEWRVPAIAQILRVQEERQRTEATQKEAERLRLKQIEDERIAQERITKLQQEAAAREAEAARVREEIKVREAQVKAELERQRVAEAQRVAQEAERVRIAQAQQAERERLERLNNERIQREKVAAETVAKLQREAAAREAEAARVREEIRVREAQIQAELERQRVAEAQRVAEQNERNRLEAIRHANEVTAAEEAKRRHHKRRKCSIM